MAKRYKCPYCELRLIRKDLIKHIDKKHEELIPQGYSSARLVYNQVNKIDHGKCRVCGKLTSWNEKSGRYNVLCDNPKCKEHMREEYKKNMLRVRGTYNILNDPEQQKKMLANRSISGSYKFSDGGILTYTGSYEKKCLEFMDVVMQIPSKDILSPGPTIEYEYNGRKHFYITDFYYIPYNLIIEVKDGGDNLNNKDSSSMRASREKTIEKERIITDRGEYNYIRLTNNDFSQLLDVFMTIKEKLLEGDVSKTYKINESVIFESAHSKYDIEKQVKRIAEKVKKDKKDPTGNQNCMLCTWCMEAWFRGYNILPRPVYSPTDIIFTSNYEPHDIIKNNSKVIHFRNKNELKNICLSSGNNSRYYIHINWIGSSGGHEFILINIDDSIYVIDAQQGLFENIDFSNKASNYFNNINYNNSYIIRMDDKQFNYKLLKYNDNKYIKNFTEDDMKYIDESTKYNHYSKDIHTIIDNLSEKEYQYINGGEWVDSNHIIYRKVEYLNNKPIGFIDVYSLPKFKSYGLIIIAVSKDARGKGIGKKLVNSAIQNCKNNKDIDKLRWLADSNNIASINMAKSLGFKLNNDGQDKKEFIYDINNFNSSEISMESVIFSTDNIEYNTDTLKPNSDNNILFITGFSGSGKSTLMANLKEKYGNNIITIAGDTFFMVCVYKYRMANTTTELKSVNRFDISRESSKLYIGPVLKRYFDIYYKDIKLSNDKFSNKELFAYWEHFINWLYTDVKENASLYRNKIIVVEGVQISNTNPELYKDHALIITGTSMLKSYLRKANRDIITDKKYDWKHIKTLFTMIPVYLNDISNLNKLKRVISEDGDEYLYMKSNELHKDDTPVSMITEKTGKYNRRRILLTSTGFTNKNIEKIFIDNIHKPLSDVKVIFVPTAANDPESKSIIPDCYKDLTNAGISDKNIMWYDLDRQMNLSEIMAYDAIYFCGGSEKYLIKRINQINFEPILISAINNGIFFIGVSAGSMIVSDSVKNGLGIIKNKLEPHCEKNIALNGNINLNDNTQIRLSDNQALWIYGDRSIIVESCKDVETARKFLQDVDNLSKKYDANFFIVTDGASMTRNGRGKSEPAVKNARDSQIEWEKKNGGDPDEDWLKHDNDLIKKEYTMESVIFNTNDIYYNKDKFDSGEINLCFITGFSGSGKSTMANEMEKSGIEKYELDDIVFQFNFSDENLKEYGGMISSFFNGPGKKYRTIKGIDDLKTDKEADDYQVNICIDFIDYAKKYAASHKDKKFIVEGVEIFGAYIDKIESLKDYAIYIKGTSLFNSYIRSAKRDSQDAETDFGKFKSFMKMIASSSRFKQYLIANTRLNKIKKQINEYVTESEDKSELTKGFKSKISNIQYKTLSIDKPEIYDYIAKYFSKNNPMWEGVKDSKTYMDCFINGNNSRHIKRVGEVLINKSNDEVIGFEVVEKPNNYLAIEIPDKKYRGYGFGSLLLEDAIKKHGCKKLYVAADNKIAIKMYTNRGFEKTGEFYDGEYWRMELKESSINESDIEQIIFNKKQPFQKQITLYHGTDISNLDILIPNSYNVGRKNDAPKMSSFWFANKDYAESFASMTLIEKYNYNLLILLDNDMKVLIDKNYKDDIIKFLKSTKGYVYEKTIDISIVGYGHEGIFPEYTLDIPVKPDKRHIIMPNNLIKRIKFVPNDYLQDIKNKYKSGKMNFGSNFIQQILDKIIYYQSMVQRTKKIKDVRQLSVSDINNDIYYRVTYNNIGIYEAFKQNVPWNVWVDFKNSKACNWLPLPPKYEDGYYSYFTYEGYKNFMKLTYPEMIKYLDKYKIRIEKFNIDKNSIVYSDKYQVVIIKKSSINELCTINTSNTFIQTYIRLFVDYIQKKYKSNIDTIDIKIVHSKQAIEMKKKKLKYINYSNDFIVINYNQITIVDEDVYGDQPINYNSFLKFHITKVLLSTYACDDNTRLINAICTYESGIYNEIGKKTSEFKDAGVYADYLKKHAPNMVVNNLIKRSHTEYPIF